MKTLAILVLSACAAFAQPAGREFFPWWDMPLTRDLNLSPDQTRQIGAITREYRDRLIDLRAAVEKADNHLSDLMNEDQPDQQKLNAAIDKLIAFRSDLTRAYSLMAARLRLVLTAQQWHDIKRARPQGPRPGQPGQPMQPMQPNQPGPRPTFVPNAPRLPRPPEQPRPPGQFPDDRENYENFQDQPN